MSITVKGVLARDVEVRRSGVSDAVAVLTITASDLCLPFEVRLPYTGEVEDAVLAAERSSAAWTRGKTVEVEAPTLEYRGDHGVATFVLRRLMRLQIDGAAVR